MKCLGAKLDRRSLLAGAATGAGALIAAPYVARADMVTNYPWSGGTIVETQSGKIRGYPDGHLEKPVQIFRGVPYGAPTGGANRFMPPQKVAPWTGLRNAVQLGDRAPQGSSGFVLVEELSSLDTSPMSEDCLFLNVWTPQAGPNSGKRPVMVWFHGGGFSVGSGGDPRYDGSNLARDYDVVVVTVNHRLNVFGFLYLADIKGADSRFAGASNAGMLDIVAALQWIHDNIAMFGGDPGNVTVFGQSGGGRKVCTLMAMPGATGLRHRSISESGMDLRRMPREQATREAEQLMKAADVTPATLGKLQEMPFRDLQRLVAEKHVRAGSGPVVDGKTLPTDPVDPTAPAISADVPWMMGNTLTEAVWQSSTPLDPIDDATLHADVKRNLRCDDKTADEVIAVYKKGRPDATNTFIYQVIATDNWLTVNNSLAGERKAALGKAPAYVYRFDKQTPVRGGKLHAPHTIEIPYVFDDVDQFTSAAMIGDRPDRYPVEKIMATTWTTFARTGDPNNATIPHWPAYDAKARSVMTLNNASKVVNAPHEAEREAILKIKKDHNEV